MNLELENKKVLITGASRGIGLSIAEEFLMEGASTLLISRGSDALSENANKLEKIYGKNKILAHECDCLDVASLKKLKVRVTNQWDELDVVVANVGDGNSVPDALPSLDQWQKVWNNGGRLSVDEGGNPNQSEQPGYPNENSNKLKQIKNHEKRTIRISNGIYSGNILEDYLNTHVLTQDASLNRIACKYDEISRKFRFFRDYRKLDNGGAGSEEGDLSGNFYNLRFNIDWRSQTDLDRPAQLNMGWLLGYRQQYYNWDEDYTDSSGVTYEKQEGYNPEAVYDNLGTRYFILSIDDFNKNYSNTLISPFQESVFTDQTAIAKVPNTPDLINFDDILYQSRRNYFGPVNIKRLHIKLYDELGRIVDLNNNDFSLSIQLEQLYDPHITKIYT